MLQWMLSYMLLLLLSEAEFHGAVIAAVMYSVLNAVMYAVLNAFMDALMDAFVGAVITGV